MAEQKTAPKHSVSSLKRQRQNAKRRARNRTNVSALKRELKAFEKSVREKPAEAAQALAKIQSALDRAARKNAIPKGRADRKKARLAAFVRRTQTAATAAPAPAAP